MKRSYIMKVYSIEKADYWRKKIEEQKNSGLNMSVFCSENNLSLDCLKYWKYRFRDEAAEKLIEIQKSDRKSGSFLQAEKQSKDQGRFLPVCIHSGTLMQRVCFCLSCMFLLVFHANISEYSILPFSPKFGSVFS